MKVNLISTMVVKMMVRKRCQAFFAIIKDVEKTHVKKKNSLHSNKILECVSRQTTMSTIMSKLNSISIQYH